MLRSMVRMASALAHNADATIQIKSMKTNVFTRQTLVLTLHSRVIFARPDTSYLRFLYFHAQSLLHFFHSQLRIHSVLENPLALNKSSSM
jgi:hypothetical protein